MIVNICAKVNIAETAPIVAVLNAMRANFGHTIVGRAGLIAAETFLGGIIVIGYGYRLVANPASGVEVGGILCPSIFRR